MTLRQTLMTATFALFGLSGFADGPQRYVVSYSITTGGTEQAQGQVMMTEEGDARIERSGPTGEYAFSATLYPTDEGLVLKTDIWEGATLIGEPSLALGRGGSANMSFGDDQRKIVVRIDPAD